MKQSHRRILEHLHQGGTLIGPLADPRDLPLYFALRRVGQYVGWARYRTVCEMKSAGLVEPIKGRQGLWKLTSKGKQT